MTLSYILKSTSEVVHVRILYVHDGDCKKYKLQYTDPKKKSSDLYESLSPYDLIQKFQRHVPKLEPVVEVSTLFMKYFNTETPNAYAPNDLIDINYNELSKSKELSLSQETI